MKKVGIITYDIDWMFAGGAKSGGASVVGKNLILELAKNSDVDLTVFCLPNNFKPLEGMNIVPVEHPSTYEGFINNIEEEVKKGDFDIVLTLSLEYMNHNPVLQSQTFRHRCENEPFPLNIIKRIAGRKKIKKQDKMFENLRADNKYIAVSESIKKDYVKNYNLNPNNVHVCHLACNQIYENMPEIQKNEEIIFGCVANNSINKGGLLFLLGLFVLNVLGCRKFKAKVISKNNILKNISKILGLKKKVEFVQPMSDIIDFYKQIDCLTLPSKNEAFGLVVLEEMSCGKPCIVSNTAGVAEIIKNNENGILFNRSSFFDFVLKMKKMYKIYHTEKYDNLCHNAYKTSKEYSWEKFANAVLNCF